MKKFETKTEAIEFLKSNNYGYSFCENYSEFRDEASQHFLDVTADYDDQKEYYETFGLNVGDVNENSVKTELIEIEDNLYKVKFYEAYIDSGVPAEDYFYAFWFVD